MSNKGWALRWYRDGDEQGILDCLTAAFGTWPAVDIDVLPIDHLRWKLSSDPLSKKFSYVAVAKERIIGTQLVIVQRLKYGERTLLADTCTDYAVHPDVQGQGLSKDLWTFSLAAFTEQFDLIMSISDSPIVLHQVETIGWGRRLANRIEWLECDTLPAAASVTLQTIDQFDERTDAFCISALAPFELAIARDRNYLNWRFGDARGGSYTIRIAQEDGRLLGYAVYATSRGKGFIADLLVLPERLDLVGTFVPDARAYFAERNVRALRCWSPRQHLYRDALVSAGFRVLRPVGQFGLGPHGDRTIPSRDDPNAAIHFVPGDTDLV